MAALSRIMMSMLALVVILAGVIGPWSAEGLAQSDAATMRFMSTMIRDRIPTIEEARAFATAQDKRSALDSLIETWLASAEHQERVRRYFHDMFGIEPWVFIADSNLDLIQHDPDNPEDAPGDLSTAGVWHLRSNVKATCGTPVAASAWWTDETIQICPSAVSTAISFSSGTIRCTDPFSTNGILHSSCGCGPDLIICYPAHLKGNINRAVVTEFRERALYAYEQNLPWRDVFGGNQFFGDRWLYHHYLWQEKINYMVELPTPAELAFLKGLPVDSHTMATAPAGGPERSGVVTSPAFFRRFNNFRSRIRAITERMLCQDVDPSLNTSGIATFVNPDLTDFDRSHGEKEDCAGCHYALDNFGSTLLGWNDDGHYEGWYVKSQLGHVLGQDGSGPAFLMDSYMDHSGKFEACMARRMFEDFTGASFDALKAGDQAYLTREAAKGPRAGLRAILTADLTRNLRTVQTRTVSETVTITYAWRDVQPVLERSCGGAACHGSGNPRGPASAYAADEDTARTITQARITSSSMPPQGSGYALPDADRDLLLIWLNQK